MSQVMAYGGPPNPWDQQGRPWPFPPKPTLPFVPQPAVLPVYDEDVVRQLRELTEMVCDLREHQSPEATALDVVRRTVRALIESHPEALDAIEAVCADVRAAK